MLCRTYKCWNTQRRPLIQHVYGSGEAYRAHTWTWRLNWSKYVLPVVFVSGLRKSRVNAKCHLCFFCNYCLLPILPFYKAFVLKLQTFFELSPKDSFRNFKTVFRSVLTNSYDLHFYIMSVASEMSVIIAVLNS